jgi:phosphoenolpyruvate-protein phosphotransferase (PTS system enzyme I)
MRLTGIGVSPGNATGRALVLTHRALDVRFRIGESAVEREIERLERARHVSRRQLTEIKHHIAHLAGEQHAYLFDAQILMLDDPMLAGRATELIRAERVNAEWAMRRACEELIALIDRAEDPYLRERRGDIDDVVGRVGMNLRATHLNPADVLADVQGPIVIVADELPASVAAQLDWSKVGGFVTDGGSWTYHTAILARSLGVPAVAGLRDATRRIAPGTSLAVDGTTGEVLIEPDAAELDAAEQRRRRRAAELDALVEFRHLPAITADGVRVTIDANLERPEDVPAALEHGAEGIGLYRSEFLLGAADHSEDAQYATYRAILEAMTGRRVTIRTFDASERDAPGVPLDQGAAGAGLRGVRLSLAEPDTFRVQLRALLRAASHGALRIMFPFVTAVEELRQAIAQLDQAAAELRLRGESPPDVAVGAMVEVPAAALTADLLARECQFLSVGSNDLIQYCLAADRIDGRVSHLYEPLHPAVLRMLRFAVRVARRHRRALALCGEMAADPRLLPLLIGLGIREVSMRPAAIPSAKRVILSLRADESRTLALRAMNCATAMEVNRLLTAFLAPIKQAADR